MDEGRFILTGKTERSCSAAVLCGGLSSRMGRPKAELLFRGKTLLSWQVDRLLEMEFKDLMVIGNYQCPGARCIGDIVPGCGPLGGIYTALCSAGNPACLIIPVDMPLVPEDTLLEMAESFDLGKDRAILLRHGVIEPFPGVYSTELKEQMRLGLSGTSVSVRAFLKNIPVRTIEYHGKEELLINCNVQEEYLRLLQI